MRRPFLALLLLAAAGALPSASAFAGPAGDRARSHLEAIAAGDVAAITADYVPGSLFQWVGGPLDGVYAGPQEIASVWAKFAKAQAPLSLQLTALDEAANPKGATVTASLVLKGKATIPLRYVLVYRNDKLVDEVWQIAPPAK
ncbi:hypothetical protein SAMN06265365_1055 [Tistlia consotensis]|uniref:SnoaL-like domain-containing protein n=1 Tax=Tistlia consotensis USBA 355 TaxID=560819 RepID=A0A1Y6BJT4_9PROT|nr:nuclear transport factor 2 family protein [Tistlia consotensis]SMF14746.1 hypothetical protein SAMN05428998_105294 [Tistlia consotensis USBA 355]SNR49274.1 hypothetical protein SAMN06265365_1055 [Tistlia consotensis]